MINVAVKPRLRPREAEIMRLFALGHTREEVAGLLHISPDTVKTHVFNIKIRLDANNTKHAIAISLVNGLITI